MLPAPAPLPFHNIDDAPLIPFVVLVVGLFGRLSSRRDRSRFRPKHAYSLATFLLCVQASVLNVNAAGA